MSPARDDVTIPGIRGCWVYSPDPGRFLQRAGLGVWGDAEDWLRGTDGSIYFRKTNSLQMVQLTAPALVPAWTEQMTVGETAGLSLGTEGF